MHPTQKLQLALAISAVFAAGGAAAVDLTHVPAANPKTTGIAAPTILSPELAQIALAQGATKLENGTATFPYYGYNGDGPMLPAPGAVQASGSNVEATKTEPDKNVYLVLRGQHGGDHAYDYGTRFLFQGHESGVKDSSSGAKMGSVTRINLDADGAHRVTLLADSDINGKSLPVFDGITWDPFAQRLLLTAEGGKNGRRMAGHAELPVGGGRYFRHAGTRRLRGCAERCRGQCLDGRGCGRPDGRGEQECAPAWQLCLPLRAQGQDRPRPRAANCRRCR